MIRNMKVLGMALAVMVAFGAVTASGASAQQGVLTTDPLTLIGTEIGEKENRLTVFGGWVECAGSVYTAHKYGVTPHEAIPANGESSFTLTPHYKQETESGGSNCHAPFGIRATITMNGCDYVIHLGETTPAENGESTYGATVDIVCPPEQQIAVALWKSEVEHMEEPETPFCHLGIGEQKGLTGVHATDEENGVIRVQGTLEGVHVARTVTHVMPITCPEEPTTSSNGKVDINITVEDINGTNISLSDT